MRKADSSIAIVVTLKQVEGGRQVKECLGSLVFPM